LPTLKLGVMLSTTRPFSVKAMRTTRTARALASLILAGRKIVSTFYVHAMWLCCFLVAGATVSSADVAPEAASAAAHIPNMTCKPFLPTQKLLPPSQWNECVGTYTYGDDNIYRGEFRHGDRDGFGVLEIKFIGRSSDTMIGWDEPATYVGSFRAGRLNGYGLLMAQSGVAYAGTFKNNIAQSGLIQKECPGALSADWTNCIGAYRFPNGNVYRGEFANGLPEGIGVLEVNAIGSSDSTEVRLPVPGVYVGGFKGGKLSGQGAVVMSGAGYLGTFRDNTFKPGRR
jgi:hypothetical protein